MMRPTAARSHRPSPHHPRSSPISTTSTTSSVYQQQQQQILYAPISNPMVTLQPCGTAFHPSCVYPNIQSHVGSSNPAPLHLQGKNNRWHSKNKPFRDQQYYQQQQQQQPSYNQKPVVLFDQSSTSVAPIPPSTTSFLVASSTFTHDPLPGEHYNSGSGVTHLLPQPYFKPPDVQSFCLIQDRQNAQQQQPIQASYYNISATNTCSLQAVNANSSFPLPNLSPYANLTSFANNQFPTSVQSSSFFTNPPVGLVFAPPRDKSLPLPTLEFSSFKRNAGKSNVESRVIPIGRSNGNSNGGCWPPQIETSSKNDVQAADKGLETADRSLQRVVSAKTDEEHYSDESSTSFDFTIEAEKMVSALCNTTSSNDLGKDESRLGKMDSAPLYCNGAGDNAPNKTAWFNDLCSEYDNGTSIGVQTDGLHSDRSHYPELIRKTAYWGCTEAEIVLDSDNPRTNSRRGWLTCLSSATRTAIAKSSTCIPVFAGDRVFADDLINAHLRISNGWLSLDNYLNKQHFPNLLDRLEPEFVACFHAWEENTYELLKQMVRAFRKFGENDEATDVNEQKRKEACGSSSFPGDVSLYTNCDLLIPSLPPSPFPQRKTVSQENPHGVTSNSLRNFHYDATSQQQEQQSSHKESKLRSKWTITENVSSTINTTKSVSNACHTDVGCPTNKLRTKGTSFRKFDSTQKSLNAEFCRLRNKVMESNADAARGRKQDYMPETKVLASVDNTESIKPQNATMSAPISYRGLYAQNCMSFAFPLSNQSDSYQSYSAANPGVLTYGGPSYSSSCYPIADLDSRSGKNPEQVYGLKNANANPPIYAGRSAIDQMEFPAVPRNKVTLLSQIEPRTFDKESEEMAANLSAWFASMRNAQLPTAVPAFEEARMNENPASRFLVQQETPKYATGIPSQSQIDANRQFQALQNLPNIQSTPWAAGNFVNNRPQLQHMPDEYDSSEDVRVYMKPGSYNVPKKRHQRKSNRRSDNNAASRNNASNYHNACGNKAKSVPMPASSTPLSHANVPSSSANAGNATLIKTSFPSASQLPAPLFDLGNSSRILKRTESLSREARQDVTWKAACASAEILLEALNVKDCADKIKADRNDGVEKDDKNGSNALPTMSQRNDSKSTKRDDADCASSYEASEDDSNSTCRLSPSTSVMSASRENENALSVKTNVKTDSWLIRTLNNASAVGKQQRHEEDVDQGRSSESSNSLEIAGIKADQFALSSTAGANISTTNIDDSEYPAIFSREHIADSFAKTDEASAKESEGHVAKATYSETVRKSAKPRSPHSGRKEPYKMCAINSSMTCSTVIPIPGRKCQRKDPVQSYQLLHKSRKLAGKKTARNANGNEPQSAEGSCAKDSNARSGHVTPKSSIATKTHGKRRDPEHAESKRLGKSSDRGWSVWYSSKKKQSLSPLAFSKLETIHRAVWQMDEAEIFKCPCISRDDKDGQSTPVEMIEDRCKAIKNPTFLEIVSYKLKNRAYHKIEHAVKDFRRIIHNARLYHQHDDERTRRIEVLSRKLEDLLKEHFGSCDFDNVTGSSPREDSPVRLRFKTPGQKSIAGRYDSTKKSVSSLTIAENTSLH